MSAPERDDSGGRIAATLKATADAAAPRPIDVDAMLVASRARRRSRRTALVGGTAAAALVLGVGGIVIGAGGMNLGGPAASTSTAESPVVGEDAGSETAPEAESPAAGGDALGLKLAPPERVNACGAQVAPPTDASVSALTVSVAPSARVRPGASGIAVVTVTNDSDAAVGGELRLTPALTVAEAGVTVWHSNGDVDPASRRIELEPGASIRLEGTFEARRCSADDEPRALPTDLPPLRAGEYEVGAVVMFSDAGGGTIGHLVSPLAPIAVG